MVRGRAIPDRRIGLEQEFFLVEESGLPSQRADEFLDRCRKEAGPDGPARFAPEFVKGLVEVNTPPVRTLAELEREYAENLGLALGAAHSLGLRLYPLGTYPLPLEPAVRDGPDYRVQVRTVGPERFADAGRCAGTHLHLELPAGTVSADAGLVAGASARTEVLNLYNLATALDPALVALTRSCPYYEVWSSPQETIAGSPACGVTGARPAATRPPRPRSSNTTRRTTVISGRREGCASYSKPATNSKPRSPVS